MEVSSRTDPRIKVSYWYPQLPNTVPTPETKIIPAESLDKYSSKLALELTEEELKEVLPPELVETVRQAYIDLGTDKVHLRSDWKSSFFTDDGSVLRNTKTTHIATTIHQLRSALIMSKFPVDNLILREHLQLDPIYESKYGETVHPEVRFIIEEGDVCTKFCGVYKSDFHGTTEEQSETILNTIQEKIDDDSQKLQTYAQAIADCFSDSSWSLDFIQDSSGEWYCIDMAIYGVYWNNKESNWHNISYIPESNPYNPITNRTEKLPEKPESKDS